jgi:hypothetical protein
MPRFRRIVERQKYFWRQGLLVASPQRHEQRLTGSRLPLARFLAKCTYLVKLDAKIRLT